MKTWKEISGREHRLVRRPAATNNTSVTTPYRGTRVTRPGPDENWATYTPKPVPKPAVRIHVPANDNRRQATARRTVRRPNDGPSDERRAAVAAAGFATDHGLPGTRVERALVEDGHRYRTYVRLRELTRPARVAANDNDPDAHDQPYGSGVGHETYQHIRPTIGELMRAYHDGMQAGGMRAVGSYVEIGGETLGKFVGLRFHSGELQAFSDSAGRKKRPWVDATRASRASIDPDGATARHMRAERGASQRVLKLRSTSAYQPMRCAHAPVGMPSLPTARAAANRQILDEAFEATDLSTLAWEFCPDGIAADYGLVAGITEAKGIGEGRTSSPQHEALAENARQEAADDLRSRLGEKAARVLDALLDAGTFADVGTALGYAKSAAHRHGRVAAERFLDEIDKNLAA